ncbi:acetoacetate decarboxylase family protein [Sphingomonas sp. SCN 67-18]|uniref:acetoacetate decarboxylase family protein n=1 Tax=uncultured Sphingomonas sp. TaxID=158754 RepID=UPI000A9BFAB4|nr:acetoacetate decarboxylase family protein [Sphingomonas sp. SCN 67-18]
MSYAFIPGMRYRMPTHFGPMPGPRQGPAGQRYECRDDPRQRIVHAAFAAPADRLARFMPPGFSVARGELHVTFCYMTEIAWLAGRGYNTFGVTIPATYAGADRPVQGDLMLILWENMADPIISGREELGFSKLYCDLPPPMETPGHVVCRASWDGFGFAALRLEGLGDPGEPPPPAAPSEGLLHYKYVPRTGAPGVSDAEYAVLTPAGGGHFRVEESRTAATANLDWRRARWEELPTLCHIVDALADIPLGPCLHASVSTTRGAKDLSDQHILP